MSKVEIVESDGEYYITDPVDGFVESVFFNGFNVNFDGSVWVEYERVEIVESEAHFFDSDESVAGHADGAVEMALYHIENGEWAMARKWAIQARGYLSITDEA